MIKNRFNEVYTDQGFIIILLIFNVDEYSTYSEMAARSDLAINRTD